MFGSNKSLRTKYKKDISQALKELEVAVRNLKKATKEHQSRFAVYYKKRESYQAALNKIGLDRYQLLCDNSDIEPTPLEKKIIDILIPLGDQIRDLGDGDLGIALLEDINVLRPFEKAMKDKEGKVAVAREMLQSYMQKKAELKSKDDKEEYNEWKKALREIEFAK